MFDTRRKLHETQRPCYFIFQKRQTSKLPCPDDLSDLSFSKDLVSSSQDLTTDGIQITVVSPYAAWYAMGWLGYSCAFSAEREARQRRMERHRTPVVHGWSGLKWAMNWWRLKLKKRSTQYYIYACISCSQHPCGGQPKPTRNTSMMESNTSSQDH